MKVEPLKLIICIVNRGKSKAIKQLSARYTVLFELLCFGKGTADSRILEYLGLGGNEKDVMVSAVRKSEADALMEALSHTLKLELPGKGVAFSIPFSAVVDYKIQQEQPLLTYEQREFGGEQALNEYELILTIVNRGNADDVMASARRAGAYGGTILYGSGTELKDAAAAFGTQVQPEKEIVLILTKHDQRQTIMDGICKGAGLNIEGNGLCFALPVDGVAGISATTRWAGTDPAQEQRKK